MRSCSFQLRLRNRGTVGNCGIVAQLLLFSIVASQSLLNRRHSCPPTCFALVILFLSLLESQIVTLGYEQTQRGLLLMESPALVLSSSSSLRPCTWVPHSPAVLHFASKSLFSYYPLVRFRPRATTSGGDTEEQRWLREEQRWLREEQRWIREEERWHSERRLMADELAHLKREVEQLRGQVHDRRSLPAVVASLKELVQSFPAEERGMEMEMEIRPNIEFVEEEVAASVSVSDHQSSDESRVSPLPSIPSMSEFSIDLMTEAPSGVAPMQPRTELRKGAEGDEVQALQVALEALGFYSGEEDIEYSIFADGTETAVKTWQSTLGVRQDGVASPALLAILFGEENPNPNAPTPNANGRTSTAQQSDPWKTPPAATMGSDSLHKMTFAEEKRDVENTRDGEMAANRKVFLLGENRWEEPGRLQPRATTSNGAQSAAPSSEEKCFSCKGEGVCMCTECEGTGELNVEDQFLDWVEEGAKCPYCEGSGATPCDVCLGKGTVAAPV